MIQKICDKLSMIPGWLLYEGNKLLIKIRKNLALNASVIISVNMHIHSHALLSIKDTHHADCL